MCFSFPHTPDKFTSTEKMILEYMSSHRDEFLFMTIGQLSAALNISEATVSRFARHVGCDDFKHLKQVVMEQTVQKGPAQKLSNTLRSGNGELLRHCIDQQQYNLQKTLELLDQKEFDRAVRAMLAARRIFIHAKNASRSRLSQTLCKPPMWCRIEAPHWRFHYDQKETHARRKCTSGENPGAAAAGEHRQHGGYPEFIQGDHCRVHGKWFGVRVG